MSLQEQAKKLKEDIPVVFLVLKDKETPLMAKVLAGVTVVYALSPIDLIPDFIPILEYLDDVILVSVLIVLTIKLIPSEVWERNKMQEKDLWKDGKPKKWYFAIPIVLVWCVIIGIMIKAIWK